VSLRCIAESGVSLWCLSARVLCEIGDVLVGHVIDSGVIGLVVFAITVEGGPRK
jgi:hypothetical protein